MVRCVSVLAKLVMMYVDTIKSGKVPCLENAVVALAQTENSKAVEVAHSLYKQLLREWTVLHTETWEELSNVHEICLKEALQLFLDRSFKDDDQSFQTQLMVCRNHKCTSFTFLDSFKPRINKADVNGMEALNLFFIILITIINY